MQFDWDQFLDLQTILWIVLFGVVWFIFGIIMIGFFACWIPEDYFLNSKSKENDLSNQDPIKRMVVIVLKNVLGVTFLIMGIIFLFTPGQGLLTIVLGILLIDFPGKKKIERKLMSMNKVRKSINSLRARYNKKPLLFDDET